MDTTPTTKALLVTLRAACAIDATDEALDVLVELAAVYIQQGLTQEGADVLAYLRHRRSVPADIQARALDLWEDLARWICPRVLLDADDFGSKATFADVVEYVFA
jgi:hypothetical protein